MIDFLSVFIFFFAVIDPVGSVPVFMAVTRHQDGAAKRKIALIAVLAAFVVLLLFVIAGELILGAMGIHLPAFQIAGGIILFLFALTMLFGESKPSTEMTMGDANMDRAIFPLAIPSIAGPGAILGAVLQTENAHHSLWEQVQITLTMMAVLLVVYLLLLVAGKIHRLIGSAGSSLVSRVMGLIMAAMATENVLTGIKVYFAL